MTLKPPLPEAIDKYSILHLKLERLQNDPNRPMVEREYNFYIAVVDAYRNEDGIDVKQKWIDDLIEINGRCWDIEAAIRQGRDDELGLEEIGRRALEIRNVNKIRVERKNQIARELGMDFFEIKIDHSSK